MKAEVVLHLERLLWGLTDSLPQLDDLCLQPRASAPRSLPSESAATTRAVHDDKNFPLLEY